MSNKVLNELMLVAMKLLAIQWNLGGLVPTT